MFTGMIEEVGTINSIKKGVKSSVLSIQGNVIFHDLHLGDSVSVNGVCFTVTGFSKTIFTADVMHETLNRSSLGSLKKGSHVNLERAMSANGRFGGHIVSGHIDGIGKITKINKDDNAVWYTINTSNSIMRYIVEKGSIAIDGISLTVAKVSNDDFSISIIPHTAKATILLEKSIADVVNIENDVVGKYIEKLLLHKQETKVESVTRAESDTRAERNFTKSISGEKAKCNFTKSESITKAKSSITKDFLTKYGY